MDAKLPRSLETILRGYDGARVTSGESGGNVFRFSRKGHRTLYLKYGSRATAREILDELARLSWLNQRLPSPRVRWFSGDGTAVWMLTTALPGCPAHAFLANHPKARTATVRAIADFLRRLHAVPAESCPFQSDHRLRMIQARRNVETGAVDESDFDEPRRGWSARRVWDELCATIPPRFDRVVTHGDFSLDNIFIARGKVTGVIDVGRLGLADPYQDLAILCNNLGEFGPDLQRTLFDAYGISRVDRRKLHFHLCLDELF